MGKERMIIDETYPNIEKIIILDAENKIVSHIKWYDTVTKQAFILHPDGKKSLRTILNAKVFLDGKQLL